MDAISARSRRIIEHQSYRPRSNPYHFTHIYQSQSLRLNAVPPQRYNLDGKKNQNFKPSFRLPWCARPRIPKTLGEGKGEGVPFGHPQGQYSKSAGRKGYRDSISRACVVLAFWGSPE